MEAERGGPVDVVVDAPGDSRNLDPEAFIDCTSPAQTAVSSQNDQRTVFQIGFEMAHGDLLNLFFLEILKAAAADRAARNAAHATCIFLVDHLNPVVYEAKEAVADEADLQAEPVPCYAQFLQGGAGTSEIPARYEGDDPLDLARLQRDSILPLPFDGNPGLSRNPLPFRESYRRGIARQASLLKRQEHDVILAFFIVAEFGEGFVERARVQIDHQRPQGRAVRIQTSHRAGMRPPHAMEAVNHIDIQIEKRIAAGISKQWVFKETLGGLDVHTESLGRLLGLRRFLHAGDPPEIRRLQGRFEQRFWACH